MENFKEKFSSYWNRQIKWREAQKKQHQGWRMGVLHLHSSYSRDVPTLAKNMPDVLLAKANAGGADFVAITDHDNDDAWREALYHPPNWIRGIEMEVFDRKIKHPIHLGILNIKDDEVSDHLSFIAQKQRNANCLIDAAFDAGCTVIANHPWWSPKGYVMNSIGYWDMIKDYHLPVEINDKRSLVENLATLVYAAIRDLPIVSTTDSHTRKVLPACTLAQGDTVDEYLENIRLGNTLVVPGYAGIIGQPAMMARYIADFFKSLSTPNNYHLPLLLESGSFIDRIIENSNDDSFASRLVKSRGASAATVALTWFVGLFLYLPGAYASSIFKVVKDIYLRNGLDEVVPGLMPE